MYRLDAPTSGRGDILDRSIIFSNFYSYFPTFLIVYGNSKYENVLMFSFDAKKEK